MDPRVERAHKIQQDIARILITDWDPLGPDNRPENSDDEYDAYVGPVYRLIASGASARDIAKHLARVEGESLGLGRPNYEALLPIAEKLCALDVRLASGEHAT